MCGYESGHITLWGIAKNELLKTIPPTEKSPILTIKFWKEIRNNFVASNDKGIVYLYRLDSMIFQLVVDRKVLLRPVEEREDGSQANPSSGNSLPEAVFSIQLLRKELTEDHNLSKYSIIALVSMRMVLVVALEPSIAKVFKYERPNSIQPSSVPSVTWGKGAIPGKLFMIYLFFWSIFSILYQVNSSNKSL